MNRFLSTLLLLLLLLLFSFVSPYFANGQSANYEVNITDFSSTQDAEYSSAYYKEGIVFCSNRRNDLFVTFSTPEEKELFNMFYIPLRGDSLGKAPSILATELMTNFNDGPACFARNDSLIIFSRNNKVNNKKRDTKNKINTLGLFTSYLNSDLWSKPEPFIHNSIDHHITMPSLSKDGLKLFFVSDMYGGYGGLDIYMCEKINNKWSIPINLGPTINTKGSESFPYISNSGELFFASNGHKGLGGLDIFSSKRTNGEWEQVMHINAPINSEFDDFGLITDCNFEHGYFSSNRNGGDDIFEYHTKFPQFTNCDTVKENQYCYLFYDEYYMPVDTTTTYYEWEFGDGVKVRGKEAEHCYDGPGKYRVELNIVDKRTGEIFMRQTNYEFELLDFEQAYITSANDALTNSQISFAASETNLPSVNIDKYFWNFGDGTLDKGIEVSHAYNKKGIYKIVLGIVSKKDSLGQRQKICVEKNLNIVKNPSALMRMKSANTFSIDENAITDQKLINSTIIKPKLVQLYPNLRSILKAFDLAFFQSFQKEKEIANSYVAENKLDEMDLNSNPAKALTLKSQFNSRRKSNDKMNLIERELKVLSNQFLYSYIDIEKQSISDSSTPVLKRLLKILLSNPILELKIGFYVGTKKNNSFETAGKVTQLIADYLIEHGVAKYRLRTAVYEIMNELDQSSKNKIEFIIIKE